MCLWRQPQREGRKITDKSRQKKITTSCGYTPEKRPGGRCVRILTAGFERDIVCGGRAYSYRIHTGRCLAFDFCEHG